MGMRNKQERWELKGPTGGNNYWQGKWEGYKAHYGARHGMQLRKASLGEAGRIVELKKAYYLLKHTPTSPPPTHTHTHDINLFSLFVSSRPFSLRLNCNHKETVIAWTPVAHLSVSCTCIRAGVPHSHLSCPLPALSGVHSLHDKIFFFKVR